RKLVQKTEHLVNSGDAGIQHSVPCPNLDPCGGISGSVTAQSRAADARKITVVAVRVTDQKCIRYGTPLAPGDLIFNKWLPWHGEDRNPPINEESCDPQPNFV